jgi:hypothetical protein
MPSSGMLRRLTFVRTGVSEKRIVSLIRVTRTGELGVLVATSNGSTKTPWPLVRKRTIPTERPPLVDEI